MIVVIDANGLIGLAKGRAFHLLEALFEDVRIPEAVWEEVVVKGQGRPGAAETLAARDIWLRVEAVGPSTLTLPAHLGAADADVIALAHRLPADRVITDDLTARREARRLGMQVSHVVEIVLAGKRLGLIESCQQVMDSMRAAGFGIEDNLYQVMLRLAGEGTP